MRWHTSALLAILLTTAMRSTAFANGYDVYASPLAWSPDGTLLAAAVNDVWPRDDTLASGALRLYGRNGEVVAELARGMCGTPSFSPDGKLLAAVVDGKLAIYEVAAKRVWERFKPPTTDKALSGKVLDLTWGLHDTAGLFTIWFSAGERFYGCGIYGMYVFSNDDASSVDMMSTKSEGVSLFSPNFGRDGTSQMVALGQDQVSNTATYERLGKLVPLREGANSIIDWTQATKPQSRPDDYHESNALFLDDHTVLFQRGGWGDWKLYRIDLNTQAEQLEVADAQQPALDAHGTLLAYVRRDWAAKQQAEYDWDLPSTVRLRNRATGEDVAVSTPGVYAELPALSPDGERIAWLEQDADGMARVAIRTVPGVIRHGPGLIPGSAAFQAATDDAGKMPALPKEATMPTPTRVVLETTKGNIVLAVYSDWAPIGAAHFVDLVRLGFYDGAPWFRVIDRKDPNNPDAPATPFVAQCGIAADPELNAKWGEATIQDDPVVIGNTRGRVAYGKTDEPNSRSTHMYINFGDNSRLDARGFAAFAEVVEGMDVADSLYKCEFEDQDALAAPGGMAAFKAMFPEADYILRAYVVGE